MSDDENTEASEPSQREAIAEAMAELRRLPTPARYRAVLAAIFCALFVVMMLLRGLNEKITKPILPYVAWYFDGLGMARTWGMFAHPDTELPVFVFGITQANKEIQLSPSLADGPWVRIVDQRMRKVRSHMANKDQRERWGTDFANYFCHAVRPDGMRLRMVRVSEIKRMNEGRGNQLFQRRCSP